MGNTSKFRCRMDLALNFFNYKKCFSLVLVAICDSNYIFVAVDIEAYGRTADSRVFTASEMGRRLLEGHFHLPSDKPLPGTAGHIPHVLVADEAFALSRHLLRPYGRHNITAPPPKKKNVLNYQLSRARCLIDKQVAHIPYYNATEPGEC